VRKEGKGFPDSSRGREHWGRVRFAQKAGASLGCVTRSSMGKERKTSYFIQREVYNLKSHKPAEKRGKQKGGGNLEFRLSKVV